MKLLATTLVTLFFFTSCAPRYYSPNTQNVPLFKQKKEGHITLGGNSNRIEFQGAYALSNSIAFQINSGLLGPSSRELGYDYEGKLIELGLGYYKPINENFTFEIFALGGIGRMGNTFLDSEEDDVNDGFITANFKRIGIQPAIGIRQKNVALSLSIRLSNLMYSDIEGELTYRGEDQVMYLQERDSGIILDPAFTLKLGPENFHLFTQIGSSFNLSDSDFYQARSFLVVGASYMFNNKKSSSDNKLSRSQRSNG